MSEPASPQPDIPAHAQARLAAEFLLDIGLTDGFSDWVVLVGHASPAKPSRQDTTTHCQACQGRCHGQNAKTLAAMLNQPAIRTSLLEHGIDIPETTRFLAAEHDGDGHLHWHPCPQPEPTAFKHIQSLLQHAVRLSAQEPCHAGKGAKASVGCPQDILSGHVGQATACVLARRQLTHILCLDRQVLLLSYDPSQDPTGDRLEKLLQAELPMLVGMNLSRYFACVRDANTSGQNPISDNPAGFLTPRLAGGEAMRMSILVETNITVMAGLLGRNEQITQIFAGCWAYLGVIDPNDGRIYEYLPGKGFQEVSNIQTPMSNE